MPDTIMYKGEADKTTVSNNAAEINSGVACDCYVPYVFEGYTNALIQFSCSNSESIVKNIRIAKNDVIVYSGTDKNERTISVQKGDNIKVYFWMTTPYTGSSTVITIHVFLNK